MHLELPPDSSPLCPREPGLALWKPRKGEQWPLKTRTDWDTDKLLRLITIVYQLYTVNCWKSLPLCPRVLISHNYEYILNTVLVVFSPFKCNFNRINLISSIATHLGWQTMSLSKSSREEAKPVDRCEPVITLYCSVITSYCTVISPSYTWSFNMSLCSDDERKAYIWC